LAGQEAGAGDLVAGRVRGVDPDVRAKLLHLLQMEVVARVEPLGGEPPQRAFEHRDERERDAGDGQSARIEGDPRDGPALALEGGEAVRAVEHSTDHSRRRDLVYASRLR